MNIFVLGRSLAHAQICLKQLHYPLHHADVITDVRQMHERPMWTVLLLLPGAQENKLFEDAVSFARLHKFIIMHMTEDRPSE